MRRASNGANGKPCGFNCAPGLGSNPSGQYRFSTVQKAVSPKAECKGYLELDAVGRPVGISFELGPEGEKGVMLEFVIGEECFLEERTGVTVYPDLSPADKKAASYQASLRCSKDKKMFMLSLTPAPSPWNISLHHLSINIKNSEGYEDWPVLPPVAPCL